MEKDREYAYGNNCLQAARRQGMNSQVQDSEIILFSRMRYLPSKPKTLGPNPGRQPTKIGNMVRNDLQGGHPLLESKAGSPHQPSMVVSMCFAYVIKHIFTVYSLIHILDFGIDSEDMLDNVSKTH